MFQTENESFFTITETLNLLHCCRTTIYKYIRTKHLKPVKVTGKLYFAKSQLDKLFLIDSISRT